MAETNTNHAPVAASLNLDDAFAVKLEACPICGGPAHRMQEDHPEAWWIGCEKGGCVATDTHPELADAIAAWNRRTPPAEVSADGMPALPEPVDTLAADDGFGVIGSQDVFTAQQMREYVAPYAEQIKKLERDNGLLQIAVEQQKTRIASADARIEELERELAERKQVPSVDTPEFRDLLAKHASSTFTGFGEADAKAALIAYIAGRSAGTVPELYTCIGKGGEYEYLGLAWGAGSHKGTGLEVYRETLTDNLYFRSVDDFAKRMRRIAAAPSPSTGRRESK